MPKWLNLISILSRRRSRRLWQVRFYSNQRKKSKRNETKHVYKKCKYSCTICLRDDLRAFSKLNFVCRLNYKSKRNESVHVSLVVPICQIRPKWQIWAVLTKIMGQPLCTVHTLVVSISVMSYPNNRITRQFIFQMVSHFFRHWKLQKWKYKAKHRTEYK